MARPQGPEPWHGGPTREFFEIYFVRLSGFSFNSFRICPVNVRWKVDAFT
jgi:hypothetical protein